MQRRWHSAKGALQPKDLVAPHASRVQSFSCPVVSSSSSPSFECVSFVGAVCTGICGVCTYCVRVPIASASLGVHVKSSRERRKRDRDREREERLSKGGLTRRGVRHVSHSLQYHLLQTLLLQRSIELTKVGGYIVYSTCSLNPLENEAVVRVSLHPRLSLSLRLSLLPSSSPPLLPFSPSSPYGCKLRLHGRLEGAQAWQ